jgi:hypothetical protein
VRIADHTPGTRKRQASAMKSRVNREVHARLYVQRRLACSVGGSKKTHRGKSQKPRSLDSREEGDQILEVYRRNHPWEGSESSGRNKSARIVTSKVNSPRGRTPNRGVKAAWIVAIWLMRQDTLAGR